MKIFGFIVVGSAALIGALAFYYSLPDHRYRIVIEVETPDGVKTGSTVLAVFQNEQTWGLPEAKGLRSRIEGDALFLDLGHGRNLVALLAHGPTAAEPDRMARLDNLAFRKTGQSVPWHRTKTLKGTAQLTEEDIPTLVTVGNVNDPRSLRVVRPDELQAVFGPGYHLKDARIEITSDPVTRGIDEKLPFLLTHRDELTSFRPLVAGEGYVPRMGHFQIGE